MLPKRDFTDRFLKSIKPAAPGKRQIIYDAQVPGFGIRVTERSREGSRGSFVLVARFPGGDNPVPRQIGNYPSISLATARQIAREWHEDIRQGIDPKVKEAERKRQEQRRRADTFSAVFDAFAQDHLSTLRTGADVRRAVEAHVIPQWGPRPLADIRRADVNELIRELRKGAPIRANRVLAYIKKFFAWCVDQDMIEASPAAAVKRPSKETKRDRVLTDWEIRAIWGACGDLGVFGRAFRFMLATGQRRSEVGDMTWSEIDRAGGLWTLSRERTKADRAHVVPLSELALSIIDECPRIGAFIFSTGRSGVAGAAPVAISGWSKAKNALDKLALEKARAIAFELGEEEPRPEHKDAVHSAELALGAARATADGLKKGWRQPDPHRQFLGFSLAYHFSQLKGRPTYSKESTFEKPVGEFGRFVQLTILASPHAEHPRVRQIADTFASFVRDAVDTFAGRSRAGVESRAR